MVKKKRKRFLDHYTGVSLTVFCFLAGIPPVLCLILWILWQGEKNRKCRIQVAPCVLPCWDGCLCLQFHHSIEKVIISLKKRLVVIVTSFLICMSKLIVTRYICFCVFLCLSIIKKIQLSYLEITNKNNA